MKKYLALILLLTAVSTFNTWAASSILSITKNKRTGDLSTLLKKRELRVLVVNDPMEYIVNKGKQYGVVYKTLVDIEKALNEKFAGGKPLIKVIITPVKEEELIKNLTSGYGDVVATALRQTDQLKKEIDFTAPYFSDARQVVVTQKGVVFGKEEDLSGKTIITKKGSDYHKSLLELNERLEKEKLPTVRIEALDEHILDNEALEMVSAKLIPAVVTYEFRAHAWSTILPDLQINNSFTLKDQGKISWGIRKKSPELKAFLDEFINVHKLGTDFGNIVASDFKNRRLLRNALDEDHRKNLGQFIGIFRKYGSMYGFDYLLLMAQGFQESGLNQNMRSNRGALGVMQIIPKTGASLKVGNIRNVDSNIHAGTKYLFHLKEDYFKDANIDDLNRTYFSFAAYNAGPRAIINMRKKAKEEGLNPNVWFDNVEIVTRKYIGSETVDYVSNISKYYIAYKLFVNQKI